MRFKIRMWPGIPVRKSFFCASLQGQAVIDYSETLYNFLVQYVGTSRTGINVVSRHTRLKNGRKCYLELKVHFKTESYEETKASKANNTLKVHIMMETGSSY